MFLGVHPKQLYQMADDAVWTVKHPIQNFTGQGRAANQTMMIPIGPGSRFAPKTPGLRLETLHKGDYMRSYEGDDVRFWGAPDSHAYNILGPRGEIVASATLDRTGKNSAYVPEAWVDPAWRTSGAFFDLYRVLSRGGKRRIRSEFANPDLERVAERRMQAERRRMETKAQRQERMKMQREQSKLRRKVRKNEATDNDVFFSVPGRGASRIAAGGGGAANLR